MSGSGCGRWTIASSPKVNSPNAYLEGVGGSAGNDIWAVGHRSNYGDVVKEPLFRHWNGTKWTEVAGPPGNRRFNAVAALSRTDAWAVGDGPLIAHWNGVKWSTVPSPRVTSDYRQPARLLGVADLSATNIWAVGFNWHYPTLQLFEHWNGQRWRVIPGVPAGKHELWAIAALSPSDIWAAGDGMEHWNGSRWTLVPSAAPASAITALSPNDIWAVGGSIIQHWNGSAWSLVPSPSSGEQFTNLTGIAGRAAGDVWAAGYAGHTVPHDGYAEHPLVEHWNGSVWKIVSTPGTGSPDSQILAITTTLAHTLWAVGFAGTHRAGNDRALIERGCASG